MHRAGSMALVAGAFLAACSHRDPAPAASVTHPPIRLRDASAATTTPVSDAAPAVPAVPTGPTGTVEGTVFLDAPIRRSPPIAIPTAWQSHVGCRDAALRYAWPFDTTTPGAFPGALVAAEAHTDAPIRPVDRVMSFRDCDINPRALFARVGDRIIFHADTRQNHLPHITGSGSTIDQVLIPGQADQEKHLPNPGRFPVTARDLPEFVGALLFVLPNRFIDTTDVAGHFRITDVPVGNVVVHAWYPGTGDVREVVAITEGHTSTVQFHLHQAPEPSAQPQGDSGIAVPP